MPAAAVASRTPAIAGMAETSVGASGETAVDMRLPAIRAKGSALYHLRCDGGRGRVHTTRRRPRGKRGPITTGLGCWARSWPCTRQGASRGMSPGSRPGRRPLLLRGRHLGVLGGVRLGVVFRGGLFRLVRALDLGGLAELADIIRLRLARHIGFDLGLHLLEIRRLALAFFLDLDDVPAELRLDRIGHLAGFER